jgi:hypothetical protein
MTNYNDGEPHIWKGGVRPVHPLTVVRIWFQDSLPSVGVAGNFTWECLKGSGDIIAFQVITPYVEPRKPLECWMVTTPKGTVWPFLYGHEADEQAKANGGTIHHMREVIE